MRANEFLIAFALVGAACGSDTKMPEPDAGEADAAVPMVECTPATFDTDCPPRPCEVATACVEGACVYGPFECGEAGRTCPAERCESSGSGESLVNRCVLVPDAPCGDGRVCMGELCVAPAVGLELDGRLGVAEIHQTRGALELHGDLSFTPRSAGPRANGNLRLTGGLTLSGGENR